MKGVMSSQRMVRLPSTLESLAEVENFLDEIKNEFNLSEEVFTNLIIAVAEAATNAIKHGNGYDPNKYFTVEVLKTPHYLVVTVEDEGPGFNPDEVPDPLQEENLLRACGRGVFVMRNLADRVDFLPPGNVVKMYFKLR